MTVEQQMASWITALERRVADLERVAQRGGSGWSSPTLLNGWTSYGGGWMPAGYRKIGDEVQLRGLLSGSAATDGTIMVLPVGYRPASGIIMLTWASDGGGGTRTAARIDVLADGTVLLNMTFGPSSPTISLPLDHASLDPVRFSIL